MSSKRSPAQQVFLGGSCNPTTWRTEIAIPFLDARGITYYNPVSLTAAAAAAAAAAMHAASCSLRAGNLNSKFLFPFPLHSFLCLFVVAVCSV